MELPANLQQLDQTKGWQKALALILLAATLGGVIIGVNAIAPTLTLFFHNVLTMWMQIVVLVAAGLLTVFTVKAIIENPFMIWVLYKKITWGATKWMISRDRLSVMDAYADYLVMKKQKNDKRVLKLNALAITSKRQIDTLQEEMETAAKHGQAAIAQGQQNVASMDGIVVSQDTQTIKSMTPMYNRIKASAQSLSEISENWDFAAKKIKFVNERKRMEYNMLKTTAEACGEAEEFLKGDTDAARAYNESVRQMEEVVSGYTATIDQFEVDAKPIMDSNRVQKQMDMDEGLKAIEAYTKNGSLELPDFEKFAKPSAELVSEGATGATLKPVGNKYFKS